MEEDVEVRPTPVQCTPPVAQAKPKVVYKRPQPQKRHHRSVL